MLSGSGKLMLEIKINPFPPPPPFLNLDLRSLGILTFDAAYIKEGKIFLFEDPDLKMVVGKVIFSQRYYFVGSKCSSNKNCDIFIYLIL